MHMHSLNATQFTNTNLEHPWYHITRESVVPGVSDQIVVIIAPVIAYWTICLVYHILDVSGWDWLEKYRIQPSADLKKNLVTKRRTLEVVLRVQALQTLLAYTWLKVVVGDEPPQNYALGVRKMELLWASRFAKWFGTHVAAEFMRKNRGFGYMMYWWVYPLCQLCFSMCLIDTYQYFVHRTLHEIPFLYKHFHSVHHHQYVPYAFGAQYNSLFEGSVIDLLGIAVSTLASRMSDRQTLLFSLLITYKGIEDHCGYNFPWHPLRFLTANDTVYHEIHHQTLGLKRNFSQPLFVFWDRILGTYMSPEEFEAKKAAKLKKN